MEKQVMSRGVEERGLIAVIIGMLPNSCSNKKAASWRVSATVVRVKSCVNKIFAGVVTLQ
jgi:hypothetical protein